VPDNALPAIRAAFTDAVVTTFSELTGTAFRPAPAGTAFPPAPAVIAHLPLKGAPPGVVVLELPAALAETLVGRYLTPGAELTPDLVADAVGEFTNVIAGQVKTALKGTTHHFHLATPKPGTPAALPADALVLLFACPEGVLRLTADLPIEEKPGT
jgi:CheY-specific phosphatase CheX